MEQEHEHEYDRGEAAAAAWLIDRARYRGRLVRVYDSAEHRLYVEVDEAAYDDNGPSYSYGAIALSNRRALVRWLGGASGDVDLMGNYIGAHSQVCAAGAWSWGLRGDGCVFLPHGAAGFPALVFAGASALLRVGSPVAAWALPRLASYACLDDDGASVIEWEAAYELRTAAAVDAIDWADWSGCDDVDKLTRGNAGYVDLSPVVVRWMARRCLDMYDAWAACGYADYADSIVSANSVTRWARHADYVAWCAWVIDCARFMLWPDDVHMWAALGGAPTYEACFECAAARGLVRGDCPTGYVGMRLVSEGVPAEVRAEIAAALAWAADYANDGRGGDIEIW